MVYLHLSLEASHSILSLFLQVIDSNSEVGCSHFCLSTHHQLTQTTVDELILFLYTTIPYKHIVHN